MIEQRHTPDDLARDEETLGRIDFLLSDVQLYIRYEGAEKPLQQVMEARNLLRTLNRVKAKAEDQ